MNFELGVCARVTTFDETDFHGGNFRGRGGEKGWFGTLPLPPTFRADPLFFFFFFLVLGGLFDESTTWEF